jgi:FdhD protein
VARRVGLCAIGRATNKRFLCFSAAHRMTWQTELAENAVKSIAND